MFAPTHPFSEDEWAIVNSRLDHVYADFTSKVAEGRGMSAEEVQEVARGRVWTGADAVRNGLADRLGGMAVAAEAARRRGGLPADAPLRLFPRVTPLDQLRLRESSDDRAAQAAAGLSGLLPALAAGLVPGLEAWGPAWRLAAHAGAAVRAADDVPDTGESIDRTDPGTCPGGKYRGGPRDRRPARFRGRAVRVRRRGHAGHDRRRA